MDVVSKNNVRILGTGALTSDFVRVAYDCLDWGAASPPLSCAGSTALFRKG
jgi:hypothetical protein